jgi:hypothetical protein
MEFKTAMGEPRLHPLVRVFRLSPLHGAIGRDRPTKHEEKPTSRHAVGEFVHGR